VASIPAVKVLESRYHARGLRVLSVTKHGDDEQERQWVAAAAQKHGMKYPCYLDADGAWSSAADVAIIPAFLLLDGDGRLAYRHAGRLDKSGPEFEALDGAIQKLLAGRR
jgi:hypothetical protein